MRIQLARTTGWYREGGQSTWGLGVEVNNFAEATEVLVADGWRVAIQLGAWALILYSEAGFRAVYGDSTQYYGRLSLEKP